MCTIDQTPIYGGQVGSFANEELDSNVCHTYGSPEITPVCHGDLTDLHGQGTDSLAGPICIPPMQVPLLGHDNLALADGHQLGSLLLGPNSHQYHLCFSHSSLQSAYLLDDCDNLSDFVALAMARSPSTKKKPVVISGPMRLMPRQVLQKVIIDQRPKSQESIADDYRALARASSTSPELSGLITRHVSSSTRSRSVARSLPNTSITSRINTEGDLSSRSIAHRRRAMQSSQKVLAPAQSTIPDQFEALPRTRTAQAPGDELRIDVGPICQSYIVASQVLARYFVRGVSRTSQMFLNAVRKKKADLLAAHGEVRSSQAFEQAWKDVEVWEALLYSHCSKIREDVDPEELSTLFHTAKMILESTWNSLGTLLSVCHAELAGRNASATAYAYPDSTPACDDEEIIQQIYNLLDTQHTVKPHKSVAHALISSLRRLSSSSKASKRSETAADDSSSISSFTLVDDTSRNSTTGGRASAKYIRGGSVAGLETLSANSDPQIMELNLSLRASKVIFTSVTSTFASTLPRDREGPGAIVRDEKGKIIMATLPELVRHLTNQVESLDHNTPILIEAFFMFFREFTTPKELLSVLKARYEEQPPHTLRKTKMAIWIRQQIVAKIHVVRMLGTWLERYYIAEEDQCVLGDIKEFIETIACDRYLPEQAAILLTLHLNACAAGQRGQRHTAVLQQLIDQGTALAPNYRQTGFEKAVFVLNSAQECSGTLVDVLSFCTTGGVEELARGLTIIESEIFHRAVPVELAFCTEEHTHPVMAKMVRWSGAIHLFVSKCLLERRDASSRAKVFELFVEVAAICKTLRNYSSALSLILGLSAIRVTRLTKTTKLVSDRHMAMLAGVRDFFYMSSNFQNYRSDLTSRISPAVPLLFCVKKDVIAIRATHAIVHDQYKPRAHQIPAIDIQMYRKLRDVVRVLERCYAPYNLPRDSFAVRWLFASVGLLEDVDYEAHTAKYQKMSETIEPPPPKKRGSWVQDELWHLGNWD